MKQKRDAAWQSVCAALRPEDGIAPHVLKRQKETERKKEKQRRQPADRHALQYCKEARLYLDGELAELQTACETHSLIGAAWSILRVETVPGSGALLVVVGVPGITADGVAAVEAHLSAAAGRLRAAVAGGTHRKRVPPLRFRAVPDDGA